MLSRMVPLKSQVSCRTSPNERRHSPRGRARASTRPAGCARNPPRKSAEEDHRTQRRLTGVEVGEQAAQRAPRVPGLLHGHPEACQRADAAAERSCGLLFRLGHLGGGDLAVYGAWLPRSNSSCRPSPTTRPSSSTTVHAYTGEGQPYGPLPGPGSPAPCGYTLTAAFCA